jgi:hypothetical protein
MAAAAQIAPGVHFEQVSLRPAPSLETGVPVFLGRLSAIGATLAPFLTARDPVVPLDHAGWADLEQRAGAGWAQGYLGFAVRGFFENEGRRCHVARLDDEEAAFTALRALDDFDLCAAPDLVGDAAAQARLLDLCAARGGCFAILDGPGMGVTLPSLSDTAFDAAVAELRGLRPEATRANGALYGPWIRVRGACPRCAGNGCPVCGGTGQGFVPPSGHVAGVAARVDHAVGVHKAPANEPIAGAIDVQVGLGEASLGRLNPLGFNAIRALPGRGIRVAGARTLTPADPDFAFVNVRRTFLTVARWLERMMAVVAFEPNDLRLWLRINRQVTAFLDGLHRRGALVGASAIEAFYVKCDAETNPPEVRDQGQVVTLVGLALARPSEFVTVRLMTGAGGIRAEGA